jgi:hypothetical protein
LDRADTRERVLGATRETCARGTWEEHLAAVDAAITALMASGMSIKSRTQVAKLIDSDTGAMLLGQSALIRRVQPKRLARIAGADSSGSLADFFCWLLTRNEAVAAFLT